MYSCPFCETMCEPWQVYCHDCGQSVSSFEIPIIDSDVPPGTDLIKGFRLWMRRGKLSMRNASFDEAQASFAEALKRVHRLDKYRNEEIHAREKLADALIRLGKIESAIEQLVKAELICDHKKHKVYLEERIDNLSKKLAKADNDNGNESLRVLRPSEYMSAPLHCGACTGLIRESEAYRFRSGTVELVTCPCGFKGAPLTRGETITAEKSTIVTELRHTIPKSKLIEAAQRPVEGGKQKMVAFWLAITLGIVGAHKFYLGNKLAGLTYLAFSWTLVPFLISIYDAIHTLQMSRVSFNLAYNLESVMARLPKDDESIKQESEQSGVFSMVVVENSEDMVDEWSRQDEV